MKSFDAKTLVHKAAVPVAEQSIRTFSHCYGSRARLEIHSDGTLPEEDIARLISAAGNGMLVCHHDTETRKRRVKELLVDRPQLLSLLGRGGYFNKIELCMVAEGPFLYFDSDVIWRRPSDLRPRGSSSAFATEHFTWYPGANMKSFVRERIPRRINSGVFYLLDPFPLDRLEECVRKGIINPDIPGTGDQEYFAYLFPNTEIYDTRDVCRTRAGTVYDLNRSTSLLMHYVSSSWKFQIERIRDFSPSDHFMPIRLRPSVPISSMEVTYVTMYRKLWTASWVRLPAHLLRKVRNLFTS